MNIQELYSIYLQQEQKISTDTRKLADGSIFFALKGDNFNANQFAVSSLEAGCAYAVIDDKSIQHPKCILVDDVLQTLQSLATHHRRQFSTPVIGITGTNGKTTTKELVNQVLSKKYKVHCTKGNLNNHIGVPLTLLSMPEETEIAIIEMGANHPLEIDFLCKIAEPDFGVVTNMGKAHLEGFGGFEGVIKTKSEMYQFLSANQGKIFVNASDELLMKKSSIASGRLYYQDEQLNGHILSSNPTVKFKLNYLSQSIEIASNLFGEHNLINMLCAARVGIEFDVSLSQIKSALESYVPDNNRSQVVLSAKENTLIWDAYNANPTSMNAAVTAFSNTLSNNKIAILGDMLELGEEAAIEHQTMVTLLEKLKIEAYLVGQEFVRCSSSFKTFANASDLREHLLKFPLEKYAVLIKGSRGIKLETLKDVL